MVGREDAFVAFRKAFSQKYRQQSNQVRRSIFPIFELLLRNTSQDKMHSSLELCFNKSIW